MRRVRHRNISDKVLLSRFLHALLQALQFSALGVDLQRLAWETKIPVAVFERLAHLYLNDVPDDEVMASDFHTVFSNIFCRYPTAKLWMDKEEIEIEL